MLIEELVDSGRLSVREPLSVDEGTARVQPHRAERIVT